MRVIPDLVTTHRVVAPDLPGQGASEVADGPLDAERVLAWLGELIERTCSSPPALVGKALGGAIAARFAIEHSDRLGRLVLVDALGLTPFEPAPEFGAPCRRSARPTEHGHDGLWRYCSSIWTGCASEMDERWDRLQAYDLDRSRTPSVKAAMRSLMEAVRVGDPVAGARPDRRSDDPDLGPPRSRDAAGRRRGRERPLRLAAARDRERPRRPRHRAPASVLCVRCTPRSGRRHHEHCYHESAEPYDDVDAFRQRLRGPLLLRRRRGFRGGDAALERHDRQDAGARRPADWHGRRRRRGRRSRATTASCSRCAAAATTSPAPRWPTAG